MITDKNVQWVLNAVSNDDGRYTIVRPWVKDGWLIGTDGNRLHMLRYDAEDGWFCEGASVGSFGDISPPAISAIIPRVDSWIDVSLANMAAVNRPDRKGGVLGIDGREVSSNLFLDALNGDEAMMLGISEKDDSLPSRNPLFLRSLDGLRQALVMPLLPFDEEEWREQHDGKEKNLQNTCRTDGIICPYCGSDDFDTEKVETGDSVELACDECDSVFSAECEIEITYTTRKK